MICDRGSADPQLLTAYSRKMEYAGVTVELARGNLGIGYSQILATVFD